MLKKTLYLDMDGVVADFDKAIKSFCGELETSDNYPDYKKRSDNVLEICMANTNIFSILEPIENSIEYTKRLFDLYDVYFLSTPMWEVPHSYTDKRLWLETHYGSMVEKRLILTNRKDLSLGHYLVDDRKVNGVERFTGEHIHFGTEKFPDWETTYEYLEKNHVSNEPVMFFY